MSRRLHPFAVVLALATHAAACTGTIADGREAALDKAGGAGAGRPNTAGQGGQAKGTGGADDGPGPEVPFACEPGVMPAGPVRVWRLDAAQYANTAGAFVAGAFPASPAAMKPAAVTAPFAEVDRSRAFSTHAAAYGMADQDFQQALDSARDVAELVLAQLEERKALCAGDGYAACVKAIVEQRGPILFHRPLQAAEVDHYVALATANRAQLGDRRALGLALKGLLAAPQFLFRSELGEGDGDRVALTSHEIATALSYALTDGPPDQALWDAAASGALAEPMVLREHVQRLLDTLDGPKLKRFFLEWLGYDGVLQVAKDAQAFPRHDGELLLDDTARFISAQLTSHGREGFVSALLTSDKAVVRGQTAWSYGLDGQVAADAPPEMTALPAGERAGLLTQPSLLVAGSHTDATDPVRRGLFVRERLLCGAVPRIAIDTVPPLPDLGADATVRARLEIHSKDPGCRACHVLMDPIGLGLEDYDHLGRFRATEAGAPVDNSGELRGAGDAVDGPFRGAIELGKKLAASPTLHQCLSRQTFRFFMGRDEETRDGCTLATLHDAFGKAEDLKGLLVALLTSDAFVHRRRSP